MATTLTDLIDGVRALSKHFTPERVPGKLLGRLATQAQRELLQDAQARNAGWGAQVATVGFQLADENAQAAVAADADGGLPAGSTDETTSGTPVLGGAPAGWLTELDLEASQDDTVAVVTLVAPFTPAAVGAATAQKTGAGWTTNALVGAHVRVVAGPGAGQRRRIVSNTSDTLTVSADWGSAPAGVVAVVPSEGDTPDTTSLLDVVQGVAETTGTQAVVTAVPAVAARRGYLVRLDATGTPYLDLAQPVVAFVDAPVPLPALMHLLGGTVRLTDDPAGPGLPLEILPYEARLTSPRGFAAYQLGEALYLIGDEVWDDAASIELRYVPVPPAFTAPGDYVLLADLAVPALVATLALAAAEHVSEMEDAPAIDLSRFQARAEASRERFLNTVALQRRNRVYVTREVM